jgi:hypothetical protein
MSAIFIQIDLTISPILLQVRRLAHTFIGIESGLAVILATSEKLVARCPLFLRVIRPSPPINYHSRPIYFHLARPYILHRIDRNLETISRDSIQVRAPLSFSWPAHTSCIGSVHHILETDSI